MKRALVCGAGGFIGHHLVKRLKSKGYWVRGVDIKKYRLSIKGKLSGLKGRLIRREKLNNCIHNFTKEEWRNKCAACNNTCPTCNNQFDDKQHKLTLDHNFPIFFSNKYFKITGNKIIYTIDDVQPLCKSCNSSKNINIAPKPLTC